MGIRVAVAPDLISYKTVKENFDCPGYVLEKLDHCGELLFIDDQDVTSLYETYYDDYVANLKYSTSVEIILAFKILTQLVFSEDKPISKNSASNIRLPDDVRELIGGVPGVLGKLVSAACQTENAIVVIPDESPCCQSEIQQNIRSQISALLGRDVILYASEFAKPAPYIITEGKSDWKHLKAALRWMKMNNKFTGLQIAFDEYEEPMGDGRLLGKCKSASEIAQHHNEDLPFQIFICIFDRDRESTVTQVSDASNSHGYRKWCEDWFSFAIPVPPHRPNARSSFYLSIEFYYQNEEITLPDSKGRRLFMSTEFNSQGEIDTEEVRCSNGRYQSRVPLIIAEGVLEMHNEKNVALPKDDFAKYILDEIEPFNIMQFGSFVKIFDVIETIIHDNF